MARLTLILAAIAAICMIWDAPVLAKESSSASEYRLPTYVWIDAYGNEPDEYAYWTVNGRRQIGESGSCCPSVMRQVNGPGYAGVIFKFYDENDRLIRSVGKRVYVDEYGVTQPDDFGRGYWRYDRWYWPRIKSQPAQWDSAKSLYEYPWPELELSTELSGNDPWTASCVVGGNIPAKWFVSYEWDLNHDGVFNRTSGRSPALTVQLTRPGRYIFAVRATDMRGYSATAEFEFSVER